MTFIFSEKDNFTLQRIIHHKISITKEHFPLLLANYSSSELSRKGSTLFKITTPRNVLLLSLYADNINIFIDYLSWNDIEYIDCLDLFHMIDVKNHKFFIELFIEDRNFIVLKYLKTIWNDSFNAISKDQIYRILCTKLFESIADEDLLQILSIFDMYEIRYQEIAIKTKNDFLDSLDKAFAEEDRRAR